MTLVGVLMITGETRLGFEHPDEPLGATHVVVRVWGLGFRV